jgi:5-methylcytosine-specific restriction protein A
MPLRAPTHRPPNVVAGLAATRRAHDKARGSAADRGYDARWRAYAKTFIAKHPWCQCERCQRSSDPLPAQHVDHVVAVSGPDDPLFWRETNHRAMAHACHSRKTVREDGALGRSSDARRQRATTNGAAASMAIV